MSRHKSLEEVHSSIDTTQAKTGWRRLVLYMGPAFLVAVGYMDPGNWATDIEGGSRYGYKLLFVLLMSNLIALLLQSLSARLGIVRGKDLAQASRETYPKIINIPLWVLAEIAIAACDLAEVLGMAIGLKLLFGIPLLWGVSIAVLDTFIILFLQSKGMRYLEAFILSLVAVIGLSFFIELFFAKPDIRELSRGFVPTSLSGDALYIAIGIIGATVMPHNLYLHSSLVQTRRTSTDEQGLRQAIYYNFIDSAIALNMAFFVNASILILAATVFYKSGLHHIVTIESAHAMLQPLLGEKLAPILFAVALIAAGQSSTITGTLAGQIVMEGYLDLRIAPWLRRLITRLIAVIPAFLVIYTLGESKVDDMLVLSQVILSLQLGFAVIPLIQFVSDKHKMGVFVINQWMKTGAWLCAVIIVVLNLNLVYEQAIIWRNDLAQTPWIFYLVILPFILLALILLAVVVYYAISGKTKKVFSAKTPHGGAQPIPAIGQKTYNTIAICVDFSGNDLRAITQGVSHGSKSTKIYLLHVVETAGAHSYGSRIHDFETDEDARQIMKYVADLRAQGYDAEARLGYGKPQNEIVRLCNETNTELLVLAKHGHSGIMDFIFGETIGAVRHRVTCFVLVV